MVAITTAYPCDQLPGTSTGFPGDAASQGEADRPPMRGRTIARRRGGPVRVARTITPPWPLATTAMFPPTEREATRGLARPLGVRGGSPEAESRRIASERGRRRRATRWRWSSGGRRSARRPPGSVAPSVQMSSTEASGPRPSAAATAVDPLSTARTPPSPAPPGLAGLDAVAVELPHGVAGPAVVDADEGGEGAGHRRERQQRGGAAVEPGHDRVVGARHVDG